MKIANFDLDVEAVLGALGIEVTEERGDWADALCPLHAEGDASFAVNLEHGGWICRHDDEGGQLVDLVVRLRELTRREALAWMADAGPVQDHSIDELLERLTGGEKPEEHDPMAWAEHYLGLSTDTMAEYWFQRGFTEETMEAFGVRYHGGGPGPAHLIWPVNDEDTNTVAFMLRRLGGNEAARGPKYLYPKGFERTLFPLDHFEGDEAVLVEGPLDAMWLHQHGYRGALAMLGSGVTARQEAWLRGHVTRVMLVLDNDLVGRAGAENLLARLGGFDLRIATVPLRYKDPQNMPPKELGEMLKKAPMGAAAYNPVEV